MEFITNQNVVVYLAGYLIGGIPFGLILAKLFAGIDIRSSGSGSIGATNVLRVVKEQNPQVAKKLGIVTLILDALKGAVVLLVAMSMGYDDSILWTTAILAVIGHCYSPYLMFEGGKGVATGLGVIAVLLPLEAIIGVLVWAFVAKVVKISSLSSLLGLVAVVISSFLIHPNLPGLSTNTPLMVICFFIFYKHIPNIIRLVSGKEQRVVA